MTPSNSPIFIVGAPRSGTTLLATMLASHSHLSCGPETHFFPHLEANYSLLPALLRERDWPRQATAFVVALTLEGHPLHELFEVSPADINAYLKARQPSIQALLESIVVSHQFAQNKGRWAEKTPNHMLHLVPIRRLYPTAQIIRIVRDPRDAARSMATQLPWTHHSPLVNAYLIERWYRKSQRFFDRDRATYTLRYEDLVTQPETTLHSLCEFIQEPFEASLLDTKIAAQTTAPDHEPWKRQVSQKLDPTRCYAWRHQPLNPELKAISTLCWKLIRHFNYPPVESSLTPIWAHYTTNRFTRKHYPAIQQLLHQNRLLLPCNPLQIPAGESILYGDIPLSSPIITKHVKQFLQFYLTLCILRSKGITIHFNPDGLSPSPNRTWWEKLAIWLLQYLGHPFTWSHLDSH